MGNVNIQGALREYGVISGMSSQQLGRCLLIALKTAKPSCSVACWSAAVLVLERSFRCHTKLER